MRHMHGTLAALTILAALGGYAEEVARAKADYAEQVQLGGNPRYLYAGVLPPEVRVMATDVAQPFWLPHLSLDTVLEHQIPINLPGTAMWRLDIDSIGWGTKAWRELAKEYPYFDAPDPLIIRVDWLLAVTSDAQQSQSYYTLLYATQKANPKNRSDFLKAHEISEREIERFRVGVVINKGRSGVADDTRLWTAIPKARFWETFDSIDASGKNDPFEQLMTKGTGRGAGNLKFDAGEGIIEIEKRSLRKRVTGKCQAYYLVDGQEAKIDVAGTNIVHDKTEFRGDASIRTPGSCASCHYAINGPQHNLIDDAISRGTELTVKNNRRGAEFVEAFYLGDNKTIVTRANEDFATFCEAATGQDPSTCVNCFRAVIDFYDRPLGLGQAAREVYARDATELQRALAYYSERVGPIPRARLNDLAADGATIPRKSWEGNRLKKEVGDFHFAQQALALWRKR